MQENFGTDKERIGLSSTFNPQVHIDDIPVIENLDFHPLEKDYLWVKLISNTLFTILLAAALVVAYFMFNEDLTWPIVIAATSLFILRTIWSYIVRIKGFKFKAYALREKDLIYKSGWLWSATTTAPFNRVQHLRIDQGPIERLMNLSRLKVYTAGGNASDMTIPGLRPESAQRLKNFIVKKTADSEEE